MNALLKISDIEVCYGDAQALFGAALGVAEGEFVTLLGRNGMGKTTTVRTATGIMAARSGQIEFAGQDISRWPSYKIARLGIGLVPEQRQVFPNLTVYENLVATAHNRLGRKDPWTLERVYGLFPRLKERAGNLGINLSGGEQQMLAIGRALMTNPRLLVLDEATEGLAPLVRGEIWDCLQGPEKHRALGPGDRQKHRAPSAHCRHTLRAGKRPHGMERQFAKPAGCDRHTERHTRCLRSTPDSGPGHWRDMSPAELARQYNARGTVPDVDPILKEYRERIRTDVPIAARARPRVRSASG